MGVSFRKHVVSSESKKKALLVLAKTKGEEKPRNLTPLGNALRNYMCRGSASYDQVFERQMKKLRPDWFSTNWSEAGKKAWATRLKNELSRKRSLAAKKAAKTRKQKVA